ncbi:MAG: FmdB family transcriptional regulator [Frankia sp.]|nr:FmdB family transcriptional regulator [Frankia sp.]
MPTYQYRCTACNTDLEVQQSFSDDALTECPRCSGRLRKVFGSVGLVFKGSGFYKTDSRSGSSASTPAQRKESSSDSGSSSGEAAKSDSSSSSSTSSSAAAA